MDPTSAALLLYAGIGILTALVTGAVLPRFVAYSRRFDPTLHQETMEALPMLRVLAGIFWPVTWLLTLWIALVFVFTFVRDALRYAGHTLEHAFVDTVNFLGYHGKRLSFVVGYSLCYGCRTCDPEHYPPCTEIWPHRHIPHKRTI